MPAIHQAGRTKIRNALKSLVTHVGVSTDQTAFGDGQTELDPGNVGAANNLVKTASKQDVDDDTFDATMEIDGSSEFTDKTIWTIAMMDGGTRSDNISRTVRTQGIGVQTGDSFTIGVRGSVSDETP